MTLEEYIKDIAGDFKVDVTRSEVETISFLTLESPCRNLFAVQIITDGGLSYDNVKLDSELETNTVKVNITDKAKYVAFVNVTSTGIVVNVIKKKTSKATSIETDLSKFKVKSVLRV